MHHHYSQFNKVKRVLVGIPAFPHAEPYDVWSDKAGQQGHWGSLGKPSFSWIPSSSQAGLTGCPLLGWSPGTLVSVEEQWERLWPPVPPPGTAVCSQKGVMSSCARQEGLTNGGHLDWTRLTHTHTYDLTCNYSPQGLSRESVYMRHESKYISDVH